MSISVDNWRRVLVHCNQGHSRAPSIGLLCLAAHTKLFSGLDHGDAHDRFLELYPEYDPKAGVPDFPPPTGRLTAKDTFAKTPMTPDPNGRRDDPMWRTSIGDRTLQGD